MNRTLFSQLNKDKKTRQRTVLVLCLVLVSVAVLVFWRISRNGMAMTGEAITDQPICGMTEHTHGENCGAKRILTCENTAHTHTDDCYQTVWLCGLEEHCHTAACFADRTADIELPETWEATLPHLSGHPVSDLIRIAESQKGYTESTRNVELIQRDDGTYQAHGYTRYGAFLNKPYCDNWSAPFVSFCLYYAGFTKSNAPRHTDCRTMQQLWQDAGLFSQPGAHRPQPGEIVFLDRDWNGTADRVGIVTYTGSTYIRTVEGNADEAVGESEIPLSDTTILGYGVPAFSGTPDSASVDREPTFPVPSETSASSWVNGGKKSAKKSFAKSGRSLRSTPTGDMPLDDFITGVVASGTTKIDETHYLTMLELSFSIDSAIALAVTDAGYKFIYHLPEEVQVLDTIIEDGPYAAYKVDSIPLELAFTYNFVPVGDGSFDIEVIYDGDYVQDALISGSDYIMNLLRFKCYIVTDNGNHADGLEIAFTVDQTLDIPPEEINENYDVSAQKTGAFTSDGKLRYEVTVSSFNGTPSTVEVADTFTYSGEGTVSAPTAISAVLHHEDGSIETLTIPAQGHITSAVPNVYDISLSLPQLAENEYYTLVYEYAVSGLTSEDAAVSAYNNIEVDSSDGNDSVSDAADYFIYNQQRQQIGKDGIPFGDYIQWHISVNELGGDIAGKVVYDDGFADERNETINGTNGVVVQKGWAEATPGVDYEFIYNGNGDIAGIRFLPADASTPNNNTYHITYYTYPHVAYGQTVMEHNEAEFDGDTASFDVVMTGGSFEKTANGEESIGDGLHTMNWTVKADIPIGGILTGTTFTDTLTPTGHYMTQAQYNAVAAALATAWGPSVSVAPVYTGNVITGYTFTVGTAGNGYLLDDGYVEEIIWQYQTTGDMDGKIMETFVNTFSDGVKTLPVGNTISPHVKKLNARKISDWQTIFTQDPTTFTFNYEDDADTTFTWVVEVTPVPGMEQYRVTDTLPAGVDLIGIKVQPSPLTAYNYGINDFVNNNLTIAPDGTLSGEIGQLWLSKTMASGSVTTGSDGRKIVDILLSKISANSDLFNGTFNVVYYCKLAESAWPQNGTAHLDLNNTVSVYADGDDYGEAENEIIIDATRTVNIVNKNGVWDKNTHMLTYTVEMNPDAENLLTSSGGTLDPEWLTFTDVLTYTSRQGTGTGEVILNLNSVTLEKEENGVWSTIYNSQWTARTENDPTDPDVKRAIIEMRVPDSKHLRLTYTYHVESSMADGITLENEASLQGNGEESGEHDTHIDVEDFQTYGESDFQEYRLIKIDSQNGTPLSGAVFTAYYWDTQNGEWAATAKTYTTDSEGKIVIKVIDEYPDETKVYSKDHAYCIMETAAPEGYLLPENPRSFYFWFSEHEEAPLDGPDDFMLAAADISISSHRIEAENQCIPDGVTDTGVYGVNLLPSFIALLLASGGLFLVMRKGRKVFDDPDE